jgi:hypothetical protein
MAETLKILGQLVPSANTLTDLYAVPAATSASVSSVSICNQNATAVTVRISLAVAGAADTAKQYLYYDVTVQGNDTFIATVGISLATTDVIRARSNTANVSFQAFGVEVT